MAGVASNPAVPFFSIVTVVRNDRPGLSHTCGSIAQQEARDFEWVVVDGKSTDGTVEFLETIREVNLRWTSESDSGIYDAMNKGSTLARGRFVVFLNAGDRFAHARVLARVKSALQAGEEAPDVLFGGATYTLANGRSVYREPRMVENYIWQGLPANHQATYFARRRLEGVSYDTRLTICGDYSLVCALFMQGLRAAYLDEPLVEFRVGDLSYQSPLKLCRESNRVQREVLGLPRIRRAISTLKRARSIVGLMLLSQWWAKALPWHVRARRHAGR